MANRAMAAKVERAKRETRVAASAEFGKSFYVGNATLGAANTLREETTALVAAYQGRVTVCPPRAHSCERVRGGFVADRATIRYGHAIRAGVHYATRA